MKRIFKISYWGMLIVVIVVIIWCAVSIIGAVVYFASEWHVPKPKVTSAEINFKLVYEIDGEQREVSDVMVCKFDGYSFDEGRGRKRKWKYYYKNKQNNELFSFRNSSSYSGVVLKNIEKYKIELSLASAEYFLGEPEYKGMPEMPYIQVYDTSTEYYKDPAESKEFLDQHEFKVISWYCDPPIQNTFK